MALSCMFLGTAHPVHDHGIQCRVACLVRRAPVPHSEVALLLLAHAAALQRMRHMNDRPITSAYMMQSVGMQHTAAAPVPLLSTLPTQLHLHRAAPSRLPLLRW